MEGRRRGYSLLELMVSLSVISILSYCAAPALKIAGRSSEASQFTQLLSRSLATARQRAVATGERITLCASTDHRTCLKHWRGEVNILVFTDRNRDYQLDGGDTLHLEQRLVLRHGDAHWATCRFFRTVRSPRCWFDRPTMMRGAARRTSTVV